MRGRGIAEKGECRRRGSNPALVCVRSDFGEGFGLFDLTLMPRVQIKLK